MTSWWTSGWRRTPATCWAASASELKAATIGKSSRRRALGLTGQYTVLVLLAAIVLIPLAAVLLQALSPPSTTSGRVRPCTR